MAKKKEEEKKYFDLGEYGKDWTVSNCRKLEWGTFFTLKMEGLQLYNLRVVPAGENYPAFIAMPEDKGKDGDYYKRFSLYLSDEDTEEVLDAVKTELKDNARRKK